MTNEIDKVEKFIDDYNSLIDNHFKVISDFLSNKDLIEIAKKYREEMSNPPELGFNLFNMISEIYYRENLHSDIIARILDINGSHVEGNKFLFLFIDFLNEMNPTLKIEQNDFKDAIVLREKGRIDISILSNASGKAIIIENKIYGAEDQHRQIPRYFEHISGIDFTTVSVVYLGLKHTSKPNQHEWTDDDKKNIANVLTIVNVVDDSEKNNLINGWLKECMEKTTNEDTKFVIKQYVELLKFLGGKAMNIPLMDKFYDFVIKDANWKTIDDVINSVTDMKSQLVIYLGNRIVKKFDGCSSPFSNPYFKSQGEYNFAIFEDCKINSKTYRFDVEVYEFYYDLRFYEMTNEGKRRSATELLKSIDYFKAPNHDGFDIGDPDYGDYRCFSFPDEENKMYDFVEQFLEKLRVYSKVS